MLFSASVLLVGLGMLFVLLLYTLWLLRAGKLTPHVTVRWMLVECLTMLAILLWGYLPFIRVTRTLDDRELLLVLAIIFVAVAAYLLLESMVLISGHTNQIRRLTQELALLRTELESKSMYETPIPDQKRDR